MIQIDKGNGNKACFLLKYFYPARLYYNFMSTVNRLVLNMKQWFEKSLTLLLQFVRNSGSNWKWKNLRLRIKNVTKIYKVNAIDFLYIM